MQVFLVFALLISLFAVVFAVQNTAMVTVSFLMWDFDNSLAVVILLTVFTGVLISIFMSLPGWIKNCVYLMSVRKKNKDLETKFNQTGRKITGYVTGSGDTKKSNRIIIGGYCCPYNTGTSYSCIHASRDYQYLLSTYPDLLASCNVQPRLLNQLCRN